MQGKIVSEYDQEIPQSPTADNPMAQVVMLLLMYLKKNLSETLSQYQTVCMQIRTNVLFKIGCIDHSRRQKSLLAWAK